MDSHAPHVRKTRERNEVYVWIDKKVKICKARHLHVVSKCPGISVSLIISHVHSLVTCSCQMLLLLLLSTFKRRGCKCYKLFSVHGWCLVACHGLARLLVEEYFARSKLVLESYCYVRNASHNDARTCRQTQGLWLGNSCLMHIFSFLCFNFDFQADWPRCGLFCVFVDWLPNHRSPLLESSYLVV